MDADTDDDDGGGFSRWGWTSSIFELCNGDIINIDKVTERPFLEVMNWLSYQKEKTDIINEKNKRR